jgi:16S rRNA (guanine966-N2)-methyltransferase
MTNLRVISGSARGRKLRVVPGDTTRPITDQVKEALFNIIGPDIQDAALLDLFGGTGAVGIEALSRGAAFVRFLDLNRQPVVVIKANLEACQLEERAEVLRMDAFALLAQSADRQFEYVYIAPPQYKEMWKRALLELDAHPDWLAEDAWIMVQIHPTEYEALALTHLQEFDQRDYGGTRLVFYERVLPA